MITLTRGNGAPVLVSPAPVVGPIPVVPIDPVQSARKPRNRYRLDPETVRKIVAARLDGATVAEAQEQFGVCASTVYRASTLASEIPPDAPQVVTQDVPLPPVTPMALCLDPALLLFAALRRPKVQRHGKTWAVAPDSQWCSDAALGLDALIRAVEFLQQHLLADAMRNGRVIWISPSQRGIHELDYAVSAAAILQRIDLPATLGGVADYPFQSSESDRRTAAP